jgi:hypothetical protein
MRSEHEHVAISSTGERTRLIAHVDPHPDGGWLAVVGLGDGASVTKWFAHREGADAYGDELAAWLERRRP